VSTRTAASRPMILLAAIAALALSMLYLINPVSAADTFTPGQNGHPTSGPYSDLNGGTADFAFQQNAMLIPAMMTNHTIVPRQPRRRLGVKNRRHSSVGATGISARPASPSRRARTHRALRPSADKPPSRR